MTGTFDPKEAASRLDRIQQLADALAKARGDFAQQQEIAERLAREIAATRHALTPFLTERF